MTRSQLGLSRGLAALLACSAAVTGCGDKSDAGSPDVPDSGGTAGTFAVRGGSGGTSGGSGSGGTSAGSTGTAGKGAGGAVAGGMGGGGAGAVGGAAGSAGVTSAAGGAGAAGGSGATAGTGGAANGGGPAGGAGNDGGTSGAGAGAGMSGAAGSGPGVLDPDALYAAPDGRAGARATLDDPTTVADALTRVSSGGTIYLRGGRYGLGSALALDKDGASGAPIELRRYPLDEERPLFDFSSVATGTRGMNLSGDYWHVYGIDVFSAGDNCLFVGGSHNTVEFSTFSECEDSGLQIGNGAADNLILNCDSYFNADASLENADGFAAKLDVGTGNKFVGCRAWNNLDDGWDGYLRPADNVTTTYERCWAMDNGRLKNGSVGVGDGNGFKTGGSDDKDLRHNAVYENCISAGNVNDGFDHNSNRGNVTLLNCAAHDNGANINFGTTNIAASLTVKNTISIGTRGEQSATTTDITNNSWQDGRSASASDFVSIDRALLKGPRKADGSLPDIDYLRLKPESPLRNAGVDVGLPFAGAAPDIGPFESSE
jgi:hypothetical protein